MFLSLTDNAYKAGFNSLHIFDLKSLTSKEKASLSLFMIGKYTIYILTFIYQMSWLNSDISEDDVEREVLRVLFIVILINSVFNLLIAITNHAKEAPFYIIILIMDAIIYSWLSSSDFDPDSGVRTFYKVLLIIGIVIGAIMSLAYLVRIYVIPINDNSNNNLRENVSNGIPPPYPY